MKKLMLLIPVVVVAGLLLYQYSRRNSRNDSHVIRVSGNIEVIDVELSFRIAGWVKERPIDEGQMMKPGQLAARLDSTELEEQVAMSEAELDSSRAALAELRAGSRPEEIAQAQAGVQRFKAALDELVAGSRPQEIAAAEAAVQAAGAEADRLKTDFDRIRKLRERNAATEQEYTTSKALHDGAAAKLREAQEQLKLVKEGPRVEKIEQARASLKEATERLTLVRKGPRQETIDQARAQVERMKQSLALAKTRLEYATLVSPISGVVLSKNIEPGEFVSPGTPIVTVGDLENVWVRAYISETDQGLVKLGQKVRVTTDSYPLKVHWGVVSFIASEAEFTPKNVQTPKERVKLVFRVKVDIRNPDMELKGGMPADAEILLEKAGTP